MNGAIAGVSHAEASLAAASGRVAGALDAVAANAEAARATLEAQREALITAVNTRFDALELMVERGAKAWKDVPDASAWVEELRGNDAP